MRPNPSSAAAAACHPQPLPLAICRKWLEEERRKEEQEAKEDVVKRGNMDAFYSNLLTNNVAFGARRAIASIGWLAAPAPLPLLSPAHPQEARGRLVGMGCGWPPPAPRRSLPRA